MQFRFEPLTKDHDRTGFDCGVAALNDYFTSKASQDVKRYVCNCFVAVDGGTGKVAGYYTLSGGSILLKDIPEKIAKKLPRYPSIGAALIGRLARDVSFKGQGLGSALLVNALQRVIASPVRVHSLLVEAKDEDATNFYKQFGFIPFAEKPLTLFLPLETAIKAQEAANQKTK